MSRLFALLTAMLLAAPVFAAAKSPNVVVFVADDLGWRDLGYSGSTFYESPNIDALAKRGDGVQQRVRGVPGVQPDAGGADDGAVSRARRHHRLDRRPAAGRGREAAAVQQAADAAGAVPRPAAARGVHARRGVQGRRATRRASSASGTSAGRSSTRTSRASTSTVGATHRGSPGQGGLLPARTRSTCPAAEPGEHLDLRLASEAAKWIDEAGQGQAVPRVLLAFTTCTRR